MDTSLRLEQTTPEVAAAVRMASQQLTALVELSANDAHRTLLGKLPPVGSPPEPANAEILALLAARSQELAVRVPISARSDHKIYGAADVVVTYIGSMMTSGLVYAQLGVTTGVMPMGYTLAYPMGRGWEIPRQLLSGRYVLCAVPVSKNYVPTPQVLAQALGILPA